MFLYSNENKKIGYFALIDDNTYMATMIIKNIKDIEKTMDLFRI